MVEDLSGMKAVAYARVSTDEKDHDQDPQTQIDAIRKYCADRNIEIVAEYSEHKSAKDLDRREWDSMMGRIMRGGINLLVARDESRISRDMADMASVVKLLDQFDVRIRYVNSSATPESGAGKLVNTINTWQAEEERRKLRANTSAGMQMRKARGEHMGKYLAFAFAEDIPFMDEHMKGRINTDPNRTTKKDGTPGRITKIYPENYIYSFARDGYSLTYVAEKVLGISHATLIYAMKKREDVPKVRYRDDGSPVYYCRYTGLKDRYSVYMTLYDEAISRRKGVSSETVENEAEKPSERVVG